MNLHEYQGKEILASYGVRIQRGIVASSPKDAVSAAEKLNSDTGTEWYVVKAQVHAGGRGKGGGVKLAKSLDDVSKLSSEIIGMQLITPQTNANGKKVNQVLIAEDVYYPGEFDTEEYYMSILLDRKLGINMLMYSPEGGMDIEYVAENNPEKIFTEKIDPSVGLQDYQARRVAFNLNLTGIAIKEMVSFVKNLVKAYEGIDASLFEINPVLKTSDNKIMAVDAKVSLDDNALFRHKDLADLRDLREEDATEVKADQAGLNFVKLDGNVGCMVNGAGLAMATMDIIKLYGKEPANFLDVGGGASKEKVTEALKLILSDKNVKGILINIFGGIMRCDVLAQGVVNAAKDIDINVPLVVRLAGTNFKEGKKILDSSGLKLISAENLDDAAKKIVGAIK